MIKPQTDEEKEELKELYNKFDTDGDGELQPPGPLKKGEKNKK